MEGMRDNTNEQTFFLRTHQGTRISPGKRLIDLNMGMTHRHELNGDAADDSTTNKGPEVADEDVILVLGAAVVHLTGDMIDERLNGCVPAGTCSSNSRLKVWCSAVQIRLQPAFIRVENMAS